MLVLDSVILSTFDPSITGTLHGGLPPSRSVGQLYLRLARLPPSGEDFDSRPKAEISVIKTGEYM